MFSKLRMPTKEQALPGRSERMPVPATHHVNGARLEPPFPAGLERAVFGMGCFWGAEKKFWSLPGVYTTAVGYAAGLTPNPTYREVCCGMTGHNEVVLVVFDPKKISTTRCSRRSGRTTIRRRGCGRGTTSARSTALVFTASTMHSARPLSVARRVPGAAIDRSGFGTITTEILPAPEFYYAEDYHQQYLSKNPDGYCGLGGTGVTCPVGVAAH